MFSKVKLSLKKSVPKIVNFGKNDSRMLKQSDISK
jgi:hypothetical protein